MFLVIIHCNSQQFGYHYKIKNSYKYGGRLTIKYKQNGQIFSKMLYGGTKNANLTPDSNGRVKILFWGILNEPEILHGNDLYVNMQDSTENFYFEIGTNPTLGNLLKYRSIPYAVTQVGAITIPFKYRFEVNSNNAPAEASSAFNAGIYIGRKWGRTRFYREKEKNHESASLTVALFTGPTSINIKKDNVQDTLKYKRETNEFGWSVGTGILYAYKDFSIGAFTGVDIPLSKYAQNWNYAYQPWIGLAIGYKLAVFGEK